MSPGMKKQKISQTEAKNIAETIYFDRDGDLRLSTHGDKGETILVVSSKTMSLVCKPWAAMLGPSFSEGQPGDDKCIPLDDDLNALSILLYIAHLQFKKVPSTLEFPQLLAVSILTDKYQATHLVVPWLPSWIKHLDSLTYESGYEEWLWIAWEFGLVEIFKRVFNRCCRNATTNVEGECFIGERNVLSIEHLPPMPPKIMAPECVVKVREAKIASLLSTVYRQVSDYGKLPDGKFVCKCEETQAQCDTIVLGSLIRGLGTSDLWPQRDAHTVTLSINQLKETLLKLLPFVYPYPSSRNVAEHRFCFRDNGLHRSINALLASMPSKPLDLHRQHLEKRRQELSQ